MAELLERLARDYGCEIHLYAQRVEDLLLADSKERPKGTGAIFWHRVPSLPGPHILQFLAWMFLNGLLRRWDTLRGSPYDLVFSPGINCLHPDVVVIHALFHRLRELAAAQDEEPAAHGGLFRGWHRRLYYSLLARLERRTYTNPRIKLAAVSQRTAGLVMSYFGRSDVQVIPNGVDSEHFSPAARLARRIEARRQRGYREDEFVLLLIGNDWRAKGLPAVLNAIAALRDLPLRLLVVGNDAPEPFYTQAELLGLRQRCRFEPPSSNVLDFYAAADTYVSPSREDSFGLPVAEAMACGLPVITSAFAGVSEFVRDGIDGFVLQYPDDPHAIAVLLQQLHDDPKLRSAVGEAAERSVAVLTWERNSEAFWNLLSNRA